jgi:lipid-A-disaccharide synthase
VDQVLSGLSFEKEWYESRGVKVEFVGHPFFDEVSKHPLDEEFIRQVRPAGKTILGILPGSRRTEVTRNFPHQVEVMQRLYRQHPNVRFVVGNYKPLQKEYCINYLKERGIEDLPISFHTGKTHEVIACADMILMVSGSVSMEVLARRKPAVVLYCVHWTFELFGHFLIKCKYMALPNLMANRQILPEFPFSIFSKNSVDGMTNILSRWIAKPEELKLVQTEIEALCEEVAFSGATARAADELLKGMEREKSELKIAA